MIICVTGTPKTGKTTTARLLAEKLNYEFIDLNELAEKKNLYCGYDKKRRCKVVDIDKIFQEVKRLGEKRNLVLESHYSHEMPCDIVIVLRTNPAELRKRMQEHGWSDEKIEENIEAEIMEVCKSEALELGKKVIEIDTTKRKPEDVVDEIMSKL